MTGRSFILARQCLLGRESHFSWSGFAWPVPYRAPLAKLCIMVVALFCCCSQPISPDDLLVSSCRFEPPLFDPFRQNTKLSYTLNQPATVSIYILDQDRNVVKTVAVSLSLSKGSHSHGWKGDSDEWTFVPTGIYIGQVIVKGKKFEATVEVFHW